MCCNTKWYCVAVVKRDRMLVLGAAMCAVWCGRLRASVRIGTVCCCDEGDCSAVMRGLCGAVMKGLCGCNGWSVYCYDEWTVLLC